VVNPLQISSSIPIQDCKHECDSLKAMFQLYHTPYILHNYFVKSMLSDEYKLTKCVIHIVRSASKVIPERLYIRIDLGVLRYISVSLTPPYDMY
jgi:hypothetical protein